MPEMDGDELCRRVRCQPAFAHLPTVMLSAMPEPRDGPPCWSQARKPRHATAHGRHICSWAPGGGLCATWRRGPGGFPVAACQSALLAVALFVRFVQEWRARLRPEPAAPPIILQPLPPEPGLVADAGMAAPDFLCVFLCEGVPEGVMLFAPDAPDTVSVEPPAFGLLIPVPPCPPAAPPPAPCA
jgi:hypothetical protein